MSESVPALLALIGVAFGIGAGAGAEFLARWLPRKTGFDEDPTWQPEPAIKASSFKGGDSPPWGARGVAVMSFGATFGFAAPYLAGGDLVRFAALLGLLAGFLALSLTDLDYQWIPDCISTPLLLAGLLVGCFSPDPYSRIIGLSTLAVIAWFAFMVSGRIGGLDGVSGGDVMMAALAGAWLGVEGMAIFWAACCVLAPVHWGILRWKGGVANVAGMPMAPTLMGATLVAASWLSVRISFL